MALNSMNSIVLEGFSNIPTLQLVKMIQNSKKIAKWQKRQLTLFSYNMNLLIFNEFWKFSLAGVSYFYKLFRTFLLYKKYEFW